MADTGPDKLWTLSPDTLQACYHYLSQERPNIHDRTEIVALDIRLTELRGAIELRRLEIQSQHQHGEAIDLGKQTLIQGETILLWTKRAVWAAIIVPLSIALISDIRASRSLPATSSPQAKATAVPLESPRATESPSESPPASPTPELTSTPTMTPIKFPPPAP